MPKEQENKPHEEVEKERATWNQKMTQRNLNRRGNRILQASEKERLTSIKRRKL
jgi:hypothetical protein